MEDTSDCSEQYNLFKNDVESRTHELMEQLERSRGSFWENFQACREYVIEQVNIQVNYNPFKIKCLFTELESQVLNEQREIDEKADEFGMEVMKLFDKIGTCVSAIGSCKKCLQTLSTNSHV